MIAGIDVGGTFTDLIVVEPASGEVRIAKVPTTVENQAFGVIAALDAAGVEPAALEAIVHGTTTTTNAMLERKIATVGLITTRGFRDVLELGRRTRPTPYGLKGRFVPLIERRFRLEVDERIDAEGEVLLPLDEAQVAAAAERLLELGAESVVIHFLHSYVNSAHEARAAEIVRALVAEPVRHRRPTGRRRVPRVRARHDRGGERGDPAGAAPLHRAAAGRARGARLRPRPAGDAGQRRHGVVDHRRRARGGDGDVGAGLGRDRRRGDGAAGGRQAGRVRQRRHLRHGRHLERRGAGARRPAGGLERPRARVRDADPRADDRRAHHRRRRRLDRLRRCLGHAARRPGERRARRRARSATPAAAPGRRSPTPTWCSAGSTRTGCSRSTAASRWRRSRRRSCSRSARRSGSTRPRRRWRSCASPTTGWPARSAW